MKRVLEYAGQVGVGYCDVDAGSLRVVDLDGDYGVWNGLVVGFEDSPYDYD